MDANQQLGEAQVTAAHAQQLLESPALQKAFNDLEGQYLEAWRRSDPKDAVLREDAYHMLRALDELRANLGAALRAGGIVAWNLRTTLRRK